MILLLAHRYPGIVHDSILYMGEGLARQSPDIFGRDLFFMHGGQGQYSLMPWLLGMLFQLAAPPQVFLWGTLASLMLFAGASWFVLRPLLPERQRAWAWFGILCLPSIYGVVSIFAYNESFLTSRAVAEALCLLAVGCLVRSRFWLATLCIGFAGLFHPLQAIAAILIAWPWAVMQDRRWLHALWAIVPVLLLAYVGTPPFDGLLRPFDPEWLAATRSSRQLFVSSWALGDYKVLAFDVFLLASGCRFLPGQWRQWCVAALAGLALGMGASLLLVDGLHLVLPTGLQLWRVHWLAHWFAIATLAALLFRHVQERDAGRALILMLAAQLAWGETALGVAWMVLLYLAWPKLVAAPRKRLSKPLAWAFAAFLALLFVNHAANETRWFLLAGADLRTYPLDHRLLMFPAAGFGLGVLGFELLRTRRIAPGIPATTAVLLLALVAYRWDARAPLVRSMEHAAGTEAVFGITLPRDAQVFWYPETLLGTWLVLRRASYISDSQLAGQMFERATLEEGQARAIRMQPLMRDVDACIDRDRRAGKPDTCAISAGSLRQACAEGNPRPPTFLVLPYEQPWPAAGKWRPAAHEKVLARYWLYRCDARPDPDPAAGMTR